MKKSILPFALAVLLLASCKKAEDKAATGDPTATDTTKIETAETAQPATPPTEAEMQKAWEEYATPGDMHKLLATDVGTWKATMKIWMDPAKAPRVAEQSAEIKMIFGGRYQESHYKGKVMGMDFEGVGTMGYDNAAKKFHSTWYDNTGTGIMYMSGDYDSATETLNLTGKMTDMVTKKEKNYRETYKIVDANTRRMEMFDTDPSGKEYKSMEITLTRK